VQHVVAPTANPSLKNLTPSLAANPIEHTELHTALAASEKQPGMRIKFIPPGAEGNC